MIEIKYNSYDELPIDSYLKIREIISDDMDDYLKELSIIGVLSDMTLDEVLEHNVEELQGITNECLFLVSKDIHTKENIKSVTINNQEYVVCDDLKKFTVAQYVDFQNYPKDEEHIAENLSTFVIPKGKKYGEEYDVVDVIGDFKKHMDISTALSLQSFFLSKLLQSTRLTLRSLMRLMKMEMKKKKGERKEEIINQIKEIQDNFGYLL